MGRRHRASRRGAGSDDRTLEQAIPWRAVGVIASIVAVGALFRLGTFYFFPSPYYVTQVEELQVGAMGQEYLAGGRLRWEYLSQAWLGALGLAVGGPSLLSVRLPSTVISILKVVPFFLWMRFTVGGTGAVIGSLLLAVSGWDSTFARGDEPQRLRRRHRLRTAHRSGAAGGPPRYVWIGFFAGYVVFEYVLYRPLALLALTRVS